jgi:hypothetical protein
LGESPRLFHLYAKSITYLKFILNRIHCILFIMVTKIQFAACSGQKNCKQNKFTFKIVYFNFWLYLLNFVSIHFKVTPNKTFFRHFLTTNIPIDYGLWDKILEWKNGWGVNGNFDNAKEEKRQFFYNTICHMSIIMENSINLYRITNPSTEHSTGIPMWIL